MIVADQDEVRRFLADPALLGGPAELRETHISVLFLGPERVFKLKRAVKLPYADLSTPERRLETCAREVERNGPAAPGFYVAARRITRDAAGGLALDGDGPLVDAVTEMRRFDEDELLDRLAARGALDAPLMETLAAEIARLHGNAAPAGGGGAANIAAVLDINERALAESAVFPPQQAAAFNAAFRAELDRLALLLDARARDGRVRLCHGDLHLGNIFRHDGRPVLFDCIEFNDRIATVDVLYDLAFLLMDLVHRGLAPIANLVMNRYVDASGDEAGLPALPFFMALRAAVRAHVTATRIAEGDRAPDTRALADEYFALAQRLLAPRDPVAVAIGGLSGSGKSTVAAALAPRLGVGAGARVLASDRIRKALHHVAPETRLPPAAYTPEVSAKVYAALAGRLTELAAAGVPVVADAVFARPEERAAIASAAAAADARFLGVWLDLDPAAMRARLGGRRGGPSDATVEVLERQLAYELGGIDWLRLDAAPPAATTAAAILARLEAR